MTSSVTRYDICVCDTLGGYSQMEATFEGEWVDYVDFEAEKTLRIAAESQSKELAAEIVRLRKALSEAHAAAEKLAQPVGAALHFPLPAEQYFIKHGSEPEKEVSKSDFIQAERWAGFRPKLPSTDPEFMNTLATGGFSGNNISGRIHYNR